MITVRPLHTWTLIALIAVAGPLAMAGESDTAGLQETIQRLEAQVAELSARLAETEAENAKLRKQLAGATETYVVYRGKGRSRAWFDQMYKAYVWTLAVYHDETGARYYNVGLDRFCKAKFAQDVGRLMFIEGGRIVRIIGPDEMVVSSPGGEYRNRGYSPLRPGSDPVSVIGRRDYAIHTDTSGLAEGDEFTQAVVLTPAGWTVYAKPTPEQFQAALAQKFRLTRYSVADDDTLVTVSEP